MQFEIFAKEQLSDYIETRKLQIKNHIENESEDYLLNVNEQDYIKHLCEKFEIELIEFNFDAIHITSFEAHIPAELFPNSFHVRPGNRYKKNVIKYHIPFTGNAKLLYCLPSSKILWSIPVSLEENCICFDIINFSNDADKIKKRAEEDINHIRSQYSNVLSEVSSFNSAIENHVRSVFEPRKSQILNNNNLMASLGVPIKKSNSSSPTFSISDVSKRSKPIISRPTVNESGFRPEPTLDIETYNDILKIIHDVGREFERLPSLYKDKEEEHLRDHFIMMLEPNFEGSATGETFNKSGKTDILLKHDSKNVFIAECKFWRGKKSFHDTIDQLLGYLTWRDSKSAVILFVRNKDFTSVVETVKNSILDHTNYVDFENEIDETWLNYKFHLPDDKNRHLNLAVMLYHMPT